MYSGYPSVGQVTSLLALYQPMSHMCVSFMMHDVISSDVLGR